MELNQNTLNHLVEGIKKNTYVCDLCQKIIFPNVNIDGKNDILVEGESYLPILKTEIPGHFCYKCAEKIEKERTDRCSNCSFAIWDSGVKHCILLRKRLHPKFKTNAKLKDCPLNEKND